MIFWGIIRAYRTVSAVLQALTTTIGDIAMAASNGTSHVELTQVRLKELLHYDPETGVFTRLTEGGRNGLAPKGSTFGSPHNAGYLHGCLDGTKHLNHRLAWLYMNGEMPILIDHINGNKKDNRLVNLRSANKRINQENRRKAHCNSKSQVLGVCEYKPGRWRAHIKAGGKLRHLGVFRSAEEAHECYLRAKRLLHEGCTI